MSCILKTLSPSELSFNNCKLSVILIIYPFRKENTKPQFVTKVLLKAKICTGVTTISLLFSVPGIG